MKKRQNTAHGSTQLAANERVGLCLNHLIVIIGCVVLALLAIGSLLASYKMPVVFRETAKLVPTYAVIAGVAAVILLLLVRRFGLRFIPKVNYKLIFCIVAALGFVWILLDPAMPRADSSWVLSHSYALAQDAAPTDFWLARRWPANISYLQKYHHQVGLVLYEAPFFTVLSPNNAVFALRSINCLYAAGIAVLLLKFTQYMFRSNPRVSQITGICACLIVLFIPLPIFADFVYGTIPSLFFCLLGFWLLCTVRFKPERSLKLKAVFVAAGLLCVFLALCLKLNALIFVLGFAVVLIVDGIGTKRISSFVLVVLLAVVYWMASVIPVAVFEKATGENLGEGMPTMAWISMGMSESRRGPGWYNGDPVKIYNQASGDTEQMNQRYQQNISERLDRFSSDVPYAIKFYAKKILTQWSEPTFQSFWTTLDVHQRDKETYTPFIKSMYNGAANKISYLYLDILQSIIYVCAFFGLRKQWREKSSLKLLFVVIFLGGFFFHIIWEAKSQYTIIYFLLLLPYAACGLDAISRSRGKTFKS